MNLEITLIIGINSITCLSNVRNIDCFILPIDWKYIGPSTHTPKSGNVIRYIFIPSKQIFSNTASFVNIFTNILTNVFSGGTI